MLPQTQKIAGVFDGVEVLPCPCCGSTNLKLGAESVSSYDVCCLDCGIRTSPVSIMDEWLEEPWDSLLDDKKHKGISFDKYEKLTAKVCIRKALESWNCRCN